MTGTAMTEANEFWKIYKLDVIAIPPNRDLQRINHSDIIFRTEREKWIAVADEIERINRWDSINLADKTTKIGTITNESDEGIQFQAKGTKKIESIAADQIQSIQRRGLPVLVGTVSIEKANGLHPFSISEASIIRYSTRNSTVPRSRYSRTGWSTWRRDNRDKYGWTRHRHHTRRQRRNHGVGSITEHL